MSGAFDSARSLLAWAREDTLSFEAGALRFTDSQPYEPVSDINHHTRQIYLKLRMEPIPSELLKLASHAVWDLKHALDHATCAAVSMVTGRPPGDLHFPWRSHPNDFERALTFIPKNQTEPRYPTVLHQAFRDIQPYPSGNGYAGGSDELCAFSKMANTTKHSIPLAAHNRSKIVEFKGGGDFDFIYEDKWVGAKHELHLGRTSIGAEFDMNFSFSLEITFGEEPLFEKHSAGTVLRQVADAVEEIINTLEAEAIRFAAS